VPSAVALFEVQSSAIRLAAERRAGVSEARRTPWCGRRQEKQNPAYSPTRLPLPAALLWKGPLICDGGPFRSFGGLPR
jgi:hypothetical protein